MSEINCIDLFIGWGDEEGFQLQCYSGCERLLKLGFKFELIDGLDGRIGWLLVENGVDDDSLRRSGTPGTVPMFS